ncbi:MAG: hypothetical protein QM813_20280 [Verrucomicrobiota bacterium]
MALSFSATFSAQAQVPPEAVAQIQAVINARVETGTVLGGDQSAASGIYTFRGGSVAELGISKIGGGGEVMAPLPMGDFTWAPILLGNLGNMNAENRFKSGYLEGNGMNFDTYGVQAGGGGRIYFTDAFSTAVTVSGIYGHTENTFVSRNAIGDAVGAAASGTLVNWEAETWSVVPSAGLRYEWPWGRTIFAVQSKYTFYHTESFASTSPLVDVNGDSNAWENRVEVDLPLGLSLLGYELRTGGFISRTELSGGVADGLRSSHIQTANVRLVADLLEKVWAMKWVGLGATYYWGDNFGGWSAGVDLSFQF